MWRRRKKSGKTRRNKRSGRRRPPQERGSLPKRRRAPRKPRARPWRSRSHGSCRARRGRPTVARRLCTVCDKFLQASDAPVRAPVAARTGGARGRRSPLGPRRRLPGRPPVSRRTLVARCQHPPSMIHLPGMDRAGGGTRPGISRLRSRLPPDRRRPEATRRRAGAAQPPAFMHKGKIVSASARPPLERLRRRPGRAGGHATAAAQASSTAAGALSSSGRPPASLS